MSQLEAKYEDLAAMGAEVAGISVDSHFSHRAFARRKGISYPLLSDFNRQVIGTYVGYFDDVAGYAGVGRRVVMVIDRDRIVRWMWAATSPEQMPDTEQVREAVQEVAYG